MSDNEEQGNLLEEDDFYSPHTSKDMSLRSISPRNIDDEERPNYISDEYISNRYADLPFEHHTRSSGYSEVYDADDQSPFSYRNALAAESSDTFPFSRRRNSSSHPDAFEEYNPDSIAERPNNLSDEYISNRYADLPFKHHKKDSGYIEVYDHDDQSPFSYRNSLAAESSGTLPFSPRTYFSSHSDASEQYNPDSTSITALDLIGSDERLHARHVDHRPLTKHFGTRSSRSDIFRSSHDQHDTYPLYEESSVGHDVRLTDSGEVDVSNTYLVRQHLPLSASEKRLYLQSGYRQSKSNIYLPSSEDDFIHPSYNKGKDSREDVFSAKTAQSSSENRFPSGYRQSKSDIYVPSSEDNLLNPLYDWKSIFSDSKQERKPDVSDQDSKTFPHSSSENRFYWPNRQSKSDIYLPSSEDDFIHPSYNKGKDSREDVFSAKTAQSSSENRFPLNSGYRQSKSDIYMLSSEDNLLYPVDGKSLDWKSLFSDSIQERKRDVSDQDSKTFPHSSSENRFYWPNRQSKSDIYLPSSEDDFIHPSYDRDHEWNREESFSGNVPTVYSDRHSLPHSSSENRLHWNSRYRHSKSDIYLLSSDDSLSNPLYGKNLDWKSLRRTESTDDPAVVSDQDSKTFSHPSLENHLYWHSRQSKSNIYNPFSEEDTSYKNRQTTATQAESEDDVDASTADLTEEEKPLPKQASENMSNWNLEYRPSKSDMYLLSSEDNFKNLYNNKSMAEKSVRFTDNSDSVIPSYSDGMHMSRPSIDTRFLWQYEDKGSKSDIFLPSRRERDTSYLQNGSKGMLPNSSYGGTSSDATPRHDRLDDLDKSPSNDQNNVPSPHKNSAFRPVSGRSVIESSHGSIQPLVGSLQIRSNDLSEGTKGDESSPGESPKQDTSSQNYISNSEKDEKMNSSNITPNYPTENEVNIESVSNDLTNEGTDHAHQLQRSEINFSGDKTRSSERLLITIDSTTDGGISREASDILDTPNPRTGTPRILKPTVSWQQFAHHSTPHPSDLDHSFDLDLSLNETDQKLLESTKSPTRRKSIADELNQYFKDHPDSPRFADTPYKERKLNVKDEKTKQETGLSLSKLKAEAPKQKTDVSPFKLRNDETKQKSNLSPVDLKGVVTKQKSNLLPVDLKVVVTKQETDESSLKYNGKESKHETNVSLFKSKDEATEQEKSKKQYIPKEKKSNTDKGRKMNAYEMSHDPKNLTNDGFKRKIPFHEYDAHRIGDEGFRGNLSSEDFTGRAYKDRQSSSFNQLPINNVRSPATSGSYNKQQDFTVIPKQFQTKSKTILPVPTDVKVQSDTMYVKREQDNRGGSVSYPSHPAVQRSDRNPEYVYDKQTLRPDKNTFPITEYGRKDVAQKSLNDDYDVVNYALNPKLNEEYSKKPEGGTYYLVSGSPDIVKGKQIPETNERKNDRTDSSLWTSLKNRESEESENLLGTSKSKDDRTDSSLWASFKRRHLDQKQIPETNEQKNDRTDSSLWASFKRRYSDQKQIPETNERKNDRTDSSLWASFKRRYSDQKQTPATNENKNDRTDSSLWTSFKRRNSDQKPYNFTGERADVLSSSSNSYIYLSSLPRRLSREFSDVICLRCMPKINSESTFIVRKWMLFGIVIFIFLIWQIRRTNGGDSDSDFSFVADLSTLIRYRHIYPPCI